MHAQFAKDALRVRQHIHQMRNRRTLVARHVADPALQQCLGDRQNTLATKLLAGAEAEVLDFAGK